MARLTRLDGLIEELEPALRLAFLEAIQDLRTNAEVRRVARLLELGDVEGALRAIHIDPAVFNALEAEIARVFARGGDATARGLPAVTDAAGGRAVIRFDARNPTAEAWLRTHSSSLVTNIVEDQRTAIREALTTALEQGKNPRSAALDIVGRINRATGSREGGIVGLTTGQARAVEAARAELLSEDTAALRSYLGRQLRDKRFDRTVLKAITSGERIPAEAISRAIARYADRLLFLRGETIARTETLASLHAAQHEALRQSVALGLREQDIRRVWRSAGDARVRDSHRHLNGQSVGLNERFSNGLLYPGEPGGSAAEVINCRCSLDVRVDFLANIR